MAGGSTKLGTLEIQWINHSTIKIKDSEIVVYIDPWSKVLKGNEEKADLILISHSHYDHLDLVAIEKLAKENTQIVCDKTSAQSLNKYKIKVLNAGETFKFGGIKIKGVPAYNVNKSFHSKGFSVGFVINFGTLCVYYAGDTDLIPEMSNLGRVNLAILPIGGKYTMNQKEAVEAVKLIKPDVIIPVHYNFIDGTEANPYTFKQDVEDFTQRTDVILL